MSIISQFWPCNMRQIKVSVESDEKERGEGGTHALVPRIDKRFRHLEELPNPVVVDPTVIMIDRRLQRCPRSSV